MRPLRLGLALLPLSAVVAPAQMMNTGGGRPSVSPDGRWIAYSAARNGRWDVYLIHPDGSGGRKITNVAESTFVNLGPPTWIGERLLVYRRINDSTRLSFVDLTVAPAATPVPANQSARTLAGALQLRPSPDGKQLVFIHAARGRPRVAVANIDGTGFHDLTDSSVAGIMPDWSRDGKHIAFTVIDSASHGQIAIADADGANYHVITHLDPTNGLPEWVNWAPDGKHLVIQAGLL